MSSDRRRFLKQAGMGLAVSGIGGMSALESIRADPAPDDDQQSSFTDLARQGPKEVIRGKRAVASSQHPIVTETMLDVLKKGGNAADALVAGSITQATLQPELTNHTGTVTCLYYDAKSGQTHALNSSGTLVPYLPFFRPVPFAPIGAGEIPAACIPGFMPGIAAIHARFGTKPWKMLVEYAIPWAENGVRVNDVTRDFLLDAYRFNTFFPSSKDVFTIGGFTPGVGELWKNPKLAATLRRLADEGPEYFTKGEWAQHFVATANAMGWHIKLDDLSNNPPRWEEPFRHEHRGYQIAQLTPPQMQGPFCALVLGILKHLNIVSLGHYTKSPDSLYYMAHALKRATQDIAQLSDPRFFGVPTDVWMDDDYHAKVAKVIKTLRPKEGVDLTKHIELTSGKLAFDAFGWSIAGPNPVPPPPSGSCENVCVDAQGNWIQAMNTLQGGGIPGVAVDGVPMFGSQSGRWLGLPGSRMVLPIGNTIVFRDGKPVLSTGSPGSVVYTLPQMLSNLLDYNMDPYDAAVLPRMLPIRDEGVIDIETAGVSADVLRGLLRLGVTLSPMGPYDPHMGSYQQAWRDPKTGLLSTSTDPRRAGRAGGL